ncbi:MAG: hypothetical protein HJJLKODD_01054 [Phycisphaerae bacterium]|nr:hypothetical protein [Phycisphaerae bacterium]
MTDHGLQTRKHLYTTALRLMSRYGYESVTLRMLAEKAGVSPGLLYKHFRSKRDIVMTFYDELSVELAQKARKLHTGNWSSRCMQALRLSMRVLTPHRKLLIGLIPILVSHSDDGLFASTTRYSRARVVGFFRLAVCKADDSPGARQADALARWFYMLHLSIILWWLLDRSTQQQATRKLLSLIEALLPMFDLGFQWPGMERKLLSADRLLQQALLGTT